MQAMPLLGRCTCRVVTHHTKMSYPKGKALQDDPDLGFAGSSSAQIFITGPLQHRHGLQGVAWPGPVGPPHATGGWHGWISRLHGQAED